MGKDRSLGSVNMSGQDLPTRVGKGFYNGEASAVGGVCRFGEDIITGWSQRCKKGM